MYIIDVSNFRRLFYMAVSINCKHIAGFVSAEELKAIAPEIAASHKTLHDGTGLGNDKLGWLTLPTDYDKDEFARIKAAAEKIKKNSDVFIVIGIGGSYLGARAAIEFLKSPNYNLLCKDTPQIFFAGNSISSRERIFCTTDKQKGTLKELSDKEGYETFVVPDNVGGRFSVLTAVGLLPIAVAGCDIDKLMAGAKEAQDSLCSTDIEENPAYKYAAVRNVLYRKGYTAELLVSYEPYFQMMNEWWKQLYGESEGKEHKGLLPDSVIFSTDLHSLGQYIQEGKRNLFETVMQIEKAKSELVLEEEEGDGDGLNFLAGKTMDFVNKKAFQGTILAHNDGGVPNIVISIPEANEFELGWLIYFFEKACGISGYTLGVNPFNQPGVEAYKKNMFALLGKPGYEEQKEALEARLGE